jgi:hypothetical protein
MNRKTLIAISVGSILGAALPGAYADNNPPGVTMHQSNPQQPASGQAGVVAGANVTASGTAQETGGGNANGATEQRDHANDRRDQARHDRDKRDKHDDHDRRDDHGRGDFAKADRNFRDDVGRMPGQLPPRTVVQNGAGQNTQGQNPATALQRNFAQDQANINTDRTDIGQDRASIRTDQSDLRHDYAQQRDGVNDQSQINQLKANMQTEGQDIGQDRANMRADARNMRQDEAGIRQDMRADERNIATEQANIRTDRQDIGQDRASIRTDQSDLRHDYAQQRDGVNDQSQISQLKANMQTDRQDIAQDRANMRTDGGDIRTDRQDIRQDRRDLREDGNDFRNGDWRGMRGDRQDQWLARNNGGPADQRMTVDARWNASAVANAQGAVNDAQRGATTTAQARRPQGLTPTMLANNAAEQAKKPPTTQPAHQAWYHFWW